MLNPKALIEKAKTSKFYLRALNFGLSRLIPFNRPHGIKILKVEDNQIKTILPFRGNNLNHIRGLHACALATISEFTTGLLLLNKLDPNVYRIILQHLEMDYHYQGKTDATATYELSDEWLQEHVLQPLQIQDSIVIECQVKVHDIENNHLATGKIHWQIKFWNKVKTKLN
ncbi:YiiD C-terminal domain-containing protein [Fulvivirgaceae bacterium BMA10]|uniref:YiiD C-terminal domain-containing protein n=1 Tax=Splendidivirga corallicola TaxID=3051826 RepID=A0ABT8KT45_9BACT|nr:YiiD C-terminal domain-containing protein [Fulvivirgaceae bacterium BMA10]